MMKKIVLAVFVAVLLLPMGAQAQKNVTFKTPEQIRQDIENTNAKIKAGLDQTNAGVKAAVTGQSDPKAALPCMDISVLFKLTPANLVPTMKGCMQDINNQLVSDTQRALDSAKAFTGSATGTTASGDQDAINCLSPALALFKAAAILPDVPAIPAKDAVPEVPAVLNPDGSIKTPAIPAVPAVAAVPAKTDVDPGPFLLFQKYREFTIVGGLTSCQAWVNGPLNATAAAGIAGAAAVTGGAALLAPIK